jgi:hypothetical protein
VPRAAGKERDARWLHAEVLARRCQHIYPVKQPLSRLREPRIRSYQQESVQDSLFSGSSREAHGDVDAGLQIYS